MCQLTIVPGLSDVFLTFFSSIVVLTLNGNIWVAPVLYSKSNTTTALTCLGVVHCSVTVQTVYLQFIVKCALCCYVHCTYDRIAVSVETSNTWAIVPTVTDTWGILVHYFHKVSVILYHNHRHECHQLLKLIQFALTWTATAVITVVSVRVATAPHIPWP